MFKTAALLGALAGPVQASCLTDLVLVYDASNSMRSKMTESSLSRHQAATAATFEALRAAEETRRMGLVTFRACSAELLSSVQFDIAEQIRRKLVELTPSGTTDVLEGVLKGIRSLPYDEGEIVVISDGLQSCNPPRINAQDVAQEALERGVKIHAVHILSINSGLQAIVEATGGVQSRIETSEELKEALRERAVCEVS